CEEIVCRKIILGSSTIEKIRDSILKSSDRLSTEIDWINELNKKNDLARASLKDLSKLISNIGNSSVDAGLLLEKLTHSINEINSYINDIQKISRQTNIISINSAIEAAKIGNAGSGFGVIAKEVKKLSEDVNESSREVFRATEIILNNSSMINDVLKVQKDLADNTLIIINNIITSIGQVISKSEELKDIASNIITIQFLNVLKLDHVIWKMNVYNCLLNSTPDKNITTHKQCRLGKWYYGKESNKLSVFDSYKLLEKPHKDVHESGQAALNNFQAGMLEQMSFNLDIMENASNEVINKIEQLSTDIICMRA
ncbi:TPA: CZB domain-containing protein, partial [Salmonella enterica subsp. enterica serovar Enteritidis]